MLALNIVLGFAVLSNISCLVLTGLINHTHKYTHISFLLPLSSCCCSHLCLMITFKCQHVLWLLKSTLCASHVWLQVWSLSFCRLTLMCVFPGIFLPTLVFPLPAFAIWQRCHSVLEWHLLECAGALSAFWFSFGQDLVDHARFSWAPIRHLYKQL